MSSIISTVSSGNLSHSCGIGRPLGWCECACHKLHHGAVVASRPSSPGSPIPATHGSRSTWLGP
eukprot:6476289-Amphidinium_carterae.2